MQNFAVSPTLAQEVLRNAVLIDNICAHSSPANIFRLARICKPVLAAVQGYLRRAFNINRHLARWFPDPLAFRALQQRTTTLISGSNALQFFDRTFYPKADLDLFTPWDQLPDVARWLTGNGYTYISKDGKRTPMDPGDPGQTNTISWYGGHSEIKVYTFFRSSAVDGSLLKVQIVATWRAPSTPSSNSIAVPCVMNVIGHSTAFALYPRATFESRLTLLCPMEDLEQGPALQKYAERGWRILLADDPDRGNEPTFNSTNRWIDDPDTWIIPLSLDGLCENLEPDPVSFTNWHLCFQIRRMTLTAWMSMSCFSDRFLKHYYVFPAHDGVEEWDDRPMTAIERVFNYLHWNLERYGMKHAQVCDTDFTKALALLRALCAVYRVPRHLRHEYQWRSSWVKSLINVSRGPHGVNWDWNMPSPSEFVWKPDSRDQEDQDEEQDSLYW
ncbi:hypothetical protein BV25DRAFT_1917010 [Artomyces pyxidatus]|uniref:Uncharacterized protein n=1 Tax=Artomyces pyxidatus TaxID=48021 RepID=A0ACB8T033_9AGAM|nr:hypothetical protein BV25DRAFT_1917010 [Artomyces pyxidatus]